MAGYVGNIPVPQSVREDQSFTATAGQTTFNTLGYTDGNRIKVTLNGVLLEGGGVDYTATNGSDVVLTVAAVVDDIVRFETFNEVQLVSNTSTTPIIKTNLTLKNDTHEDTDGGRESTVIFSGEQSGGEISTLAEIEASHDGTADDQKGDLIFRTNDGNDGTSPTERLRINSGGDMLFSSEDPSLTLANTTHEDSDGGRESTIAFQGEQSGGEISLLAQIEAAHDGTADDEKGDLIFRTNDGSDGTSPTEAMRIQSDQKIGVGLSSNISSALHVNSEVSLGPDNNNRMIVGSTSGGVGSIGTIEGGTASFSTATFKGGNVGIGTAAPLRQLHIHNTSANSEIAFTAGTSGTSSILFGDGQTGADVYKGYLQYQHNGDYMILATNESERFRINSASNTFGFDFISPSPYGVRFRANGSYSHQEGIYLADHSNSLKWKANMDGSSSQVGASNATAHNATSDYRLKENIEDLTDGITKVKQLQPRKFNWISDETDTLEDGFIAHEVATAVPSVVKGSKDGVVVWQEGEELPDGVSLGDNKLDDDGNTIPEYQGIEYGKLTVVLTKALQEAIAKIETLETKVAALEAE